MHDDPAWHSKIPEDVRQKGLQYLIDEYKGNVNKANHVYMVLTSGENTAFNNMEGLIKESTLGAKDLSILMKRKEIAPEIRALMGEYTDPLINYTRSMLKMYHLVGNSHFLNEIKKVGMGEFLYDENAGPIPPEANVRISGVNSKVLAPLNGLWAHPDTVQAFEDALNKNSLTGWWAKIIGINGLVKWGKVVASPGTQARNFIGNIPNIIATGSFKPSAVPKAWDTMRAYITATDGTALDYYREMVQREILLDTPNAGQLQDLMENGGNDMLAALESGIIDSFGKVNIDPTLPIEKIKSFKKILDKFYRAGDDFWKIIAFESQLADYMAAKNMTREEAAPIVASRVRRTMFTYSQTGTYMKTLGRVPIVGPFVAFASESVRSGIEGVKIVREDWADPELKHLARRRVVGLSIAHSWMFGLASLSAAMHGVDDDELESVRELGSTWSENANLMVLGRDENGELITLDLSYMDMFNIWHRPLVAIMRDQPIEQGLIDAAFETLKPFFGPDLLIQNVGELALNQKIQGGRVYNPDAPVLDNLNDIGDHMYRGLAPGVAQNIRRIWKAAEGQRSKSGKVYDLQTELGALVGFRASVFDPKMALNYRVINFKEGLSNANSYLYNVAGDVNPRDESELASAFNAANGMRERAYDDFMRLVNAAKKAGVSDMEIRRVLRAANVSKKYANSLARGKEVPKWNLGRSFLKGNIKRTKLLLGREQAQELRERKRILSRISRSSQ